MVTWLNLYTLPSHTSMCNRDKRTDLDHWLEMGDKQGWGLMDKGAGGWGGGENHWRKLDLAEAPTNFRVQITANNNLIFLNRYANKTANWSLQQEKHIWLDHRNKNKICSSRKQQYPPPKGRSLEYLSGGGSRKPNVLKKSIELNWNFHKGGEVQINKYPAVGWGWVRIFSGTTH